LGEVIDGLVLTAVLAAAVLHAGWNAMVKGVRDQATLFTRTGAAAAVIAAAALPWVATPAPASWPWLIGSVAVHVGYNLALLAAYRLGDFSQTYPLARGLGPVVATAIAYVTIREPLSAMALAGVLLVCGAIAVLGLTPWRRVRANRPAVAAAVATGIAIGTYTVVDGIGVRRSGSSLGYALVLTGLQGLVTIAVMARLRSTPAMRARAVGSPNGATWPLALTTTLMSIGAYGLVLWAQTRGALGSIAALRESSVVIAALLGAVVFREALSRLRIVASVVVTAGAVLLAAGS
jgi:drug/metabolite transporter (DMT)-like permease